MRQAKVMVITPVWCTSSNLRQLQLLQSIYWIQRQTEKDFIHVIVDDGSTDDTSEILDGFADKIDSIVVYHKENGGSSSAVNYGVHRALKEIIPEFITISHSDDLLTPNSLEDRIRLAKAKKADMVYSDLISFYDSEGITNHIIARDFTDSDELLENLLNHVYIPYPTMLWERDFFVKRLGGYDERLTSAEDWEIAIRSAEEMAKKGGKRHGVLNKITAAYRIHDNNLGKSNFRDGTKWKCYRTILGKHFKGSQYQKRLIIETYRIFRMWAPQYLPLRLKDKLRNIRDNLLMTPPQAMPFRSEFLDEVRKIDYRMLYN